MQNLPFARYRAEQGREPSKLRHVQLLWISSLCYRYQGRFLGPSRKEKEDAGLDWHFCILWLDWHSSVCGRKVSVALLGLWVTVTV